MQRSCLQKGIEAFRQRLSVEMNGETYFYISRNLFDFYREYLRKTRREASHQNISETSPIDPGTVVISALLLKPIFSFLQDYNTARPAREELL